MKNIHLFSLLLATALIAFACKDEPPVTPPTNNNNGKTKKEMLTQKNWKVSSLVSNSTDIWATAFVAACNKDNEYHFRSDDSMAQYDKNMKCNSSDPDSLVTSYKLYNNNTQLILNLKLTSSTTLNDTADIVDLSETALKVNAEYSGLPATISFVHP